MNTPFSRRVHAETAQGVSKPPPGGHKRAVTDSLAPARDILRRVFGHAEFRGLQAAVITEILAGRSAMAVLPTGGGKSLCYRSRPCCAPASAWWSRR
jgi:superfamily II DNA helicase RecQ